MTSKIFAMRIPVVGISACDFASFLKVLVDAVDKLVNEFRFSSRSNFNLLILSF